MAVLVHHHCMAAVLVHHHCMAAVLEHHRCTAVVVACYSDPHRRQLAVGSSSTAHLEQQASSFCASCSASYADGDGDGAYTVSYDADGAVRHPRVSFHCYYPRGVAAAVAYYSEAHLRQKGVMHNSRQTGVTTVWHSNRPMQEAQNNLRQAAAAAAVAAAAVAAAAYYSDPRRHQLAVDRSSKVE